MKLVIFHLGYFIALVCLSFFTYFFLLGMAFGGAIHLFILAVPLVFSVSWIVDYIWRFLSMKPGTEKIQLIPPAKNEAFVSLFLSSIFIVYSLLLTTLFPLPNEMSPPWMFLGTPAVLLLIWYVLLYRYTKHKTDNMQRISSLLLVVVSFAYTYNILEVYVVEFMR